MGCSGYIGGGPIVIVVDVMAAVVVGSWAAIRVGVRISVAAPVALVAVDKGVPWLKKGRKQEENIDLLNF